MTDLGRFVCWLRALVRRDYEPVAVIDAAEFEAARRDPKVQRLLADAQEYGDRLEREGRNL